MQAQSLVTWVVEHLVARNKMQSLFVATDGLVRKRRSNLIQILTVKVRI